MPIPTRPGLRDDEHNPYAPPRSESAPEPTAEGVFARDRYFLRQKLFAIHERYKVFGEGEEVLLYVKRPARVLKHLLALVVLIIGILFGVFIGIAIAAATWGPLGAVVGLLFVVGAIFFGLHLIPLRHLHFYSDEGECALVMSISQDNRWIIPVAWFTLCDSEGAPIARFRKNWLWNLFRRRWSILAPNGDALLMVKEDSIVKSIIRRIAPDIIAAFMRTNFVFLAADGMGAPLGMFNRKLAIRDHYLLDLTPDTERTVDRRIALAMGVLLDTGEKR